MRSRYLLLAIATFFITISAAPASSEDTRTWNVLIQLRFCGCTLQYVEAYGPSKDTSILEKPVLSKRTDYIAQWTFLPEMGKAYQIREIIYTMIQGSGYWALRVTVKSDSTGLEHSVWIWVSPIGIKIGPPITPVPNLDASDQEWRDWATQHHMADARLPIKFSMLYYKKDATATIALRIRTKDADGKIAECPEALPTTTIQ